jgi:hypothetical protein
MFPVKSKLGWNIHLIAITKYFIYQLDNQEGCRCGKKNKHSTPRKTKITFFSSKTRNLIDNL